jgi:long-chain acyl-CoA synthetase
VNLVDVLLPVTTTSLRTADSVALVTPTARWSRGELAAAAAAVAGALDERSAAGDHIAILADNDEHFIAAYLGVLAAGCVVVPLNPVAPPAELDAELSAVGAVLVLCGPGYVSPTAAVEALDITTALAHAAHESRVARHDDDLAVLLFTSGTAGMPKAAMLSHGNLIANIRQVQSAPGLQLRADDIGLGVLPFFHVFGLNVVIGLTLAAGATLVSLPRFDPAASVAAIREHGVTVIAAVPAIFRAWLDLPADVDAAAFASVRLAVSGAAALGTETLNAMHSRFGVRVHEGYGLTEASPIVTTTAVERSVRPGSIGPPLPEVSIRLVDRDGDDVLHGDPGEIWVHGPNVFRGYWNDLDQTARVLVDGWLHTGDIAVADDDGWLTLVDREKDLIIVSGFNVYPGEVEAALMEHDDVVEAAVVGEADMRSGERVVAFVVAREGANPTATILTAHLRRRLARYKIPHRFELVGELPYTFAGKVLRRALRDSERVDAVQKPA